MSDDIFDRKYRLDVLLGIVKTPVDVVHRMVDLTRQTGRSYTLVEALPANGKAIIVVHRRDAAEHIKDYARRMFGPQYPIKNLRFVTTEALRSGKHSLRGLRLPVFVDNAVLDMLMIDWVKDINQMFNPKEENGRTEEEDKEFWNEVANMARTLPRDYIR